MQIIYWFFIILIFYCYFGYPVFIRLIAKKNSKIIKKEYHEPTVSVLISAYNEEDVIQAKINNLLNLNYPKEKIEFLIGSDASTDKTVQILNSVSDLRVSIFDYNQRRGKMAVLNDLANHAKGEILLFTDARQIFNDDVVRELVANFSDLSVGCVSGELMFTSSEEATAKGVSLYWNYEKFIRRQESAVHSMLGATGAIYAIRKELYVPLPEDIILDDMFIPFKIIQKGYRAIFDHTAKAYDRVADNPAEENRRKVRTLSGNYQLFGRFLDLFVPGKSPIAIQLISHKLLRLIVPFLMIAIFVINFFLLEQSFYFVIFVLQLVFYGMAIIGGVARNKNYGIIKLVSKVCYVPYVFCLLNYSAFMGFVKFITSKQQVTWQKARG